MLPGAGLELSVTKTEKILLAISGIEYISFEWYEARHLMPADLIFSTAKKSFSENN